MAKKQVRGLFDYLALKEGEDWEIAPNSENFVHGMGLGATKEATRWAYIGYNYELAQKIKGYSKKLKGRPKLSQYRDIDCRRAYALWLYVQNTIEEDLREKVKNRHLIEWFKTIHKNENIYSDLFNESNVESSVSRGRKKLEINSKWQRKVCEKINAI